MSHIQQQVARAFAFTGATLLIGVVVFFITQGMIPFVELPDIAGAVILAGFVLVFLNLSLTMGRRFCSRTFELENFPYLLGFVLVLPTLILSFLTERLTGFSSYLLFSATIILSAQAGAWIGIKSGRRKRDKLINEALETGESGKGEV